MKKLLPIAVFLFAFCLASCNKPAENPPEVTTAASAFEPAETAETTTFATVATLDEWITLPTTAAPETTTKAPETAPAPPVTTKAAVTPATNEEPPKVTETTAETAAITARTFVEEVYDDTTFEPYLERIYDESKLKFYTDKGTYKNNEKGTLTLENLSSDHITFTPDAHLFYFDGEKWVAIPMGGAWCEEFAGSLLTFHREDGANVRSFKLDIDEDPYVKLSAGKYRFVREVSWPEVIINGNHPPRVTLTAEFEIVE